MTYLIVSVTKVVVFILTYLMTGYPMSSSIDKLIILLSLTSMFVLFVPTNV